MKSRASGFTLAAALIALTPFSLTPALLFSGLYAAGKNLHAGERQAAANYNQRLALNLLRRLVEQAVPLYLVDRDGGRRLIFRGEREALHFISPLPSHRGAARVVAMDALKPAAPAPAPHRP